MSLSHRSNTIFSPDATDASQADFVSSYTVTVYPVGGRVRTAQSSTIINVDAGHSFRVNDKILIWDGSTATFSGTDSVDTTTATSITMKTGSYTVSVGDLVVNLGPDTGTTAPTYNFSHVRIYSDADGDVVVSNARVTTTAAGEFSYYHKGDGRMWELIRDSNGAVADVVPGFGGSFGRHNVTDYGARGDESVDDTKSIDTANLAAGTTGVVYFADGTYSINGLDAFQGSVDAHPNAILSYTGSGGTAFELREGTGATLSRYKRHQLPRIHHASKEWSSVGGASTDIGVVLTNLYETRTYIPQVRNFSIGVLARGLGEGFAYNDTFMGHMNNNMVGVKLEPDSSGWVNENNWYGGRYQVGSSEGTDISGSRHIWIADNASNPTNNNWFWKPSVEGSGPEFTIECFGSWNGFVGARFEGTPKIKWGSGTQTAKDNVVIYGRGLANVTVTHGAGAIRNHILNPSTYDLNLGNGMRLMCGSSGDPALLVYPAKSNSFGGISNFDTEWEVSISANETKFKETADADSRFEINNATGDLFWGDGTNAPDVRLRRGTADTLETFDRWVLATITTLANDATPSVAVGNLFKTGGTTPITDFDDGRVGQTIRVLSEHAITITHNVSNIVLNGAVNFVMASGDTLTLTMFNTGIWHEVARSDNT